MTRDELQKEWADIWLNSPVGGILYLCPRAGKTRVTGRILIDGDYRNPLIIAPNIDIQHGWDQEFKRIGYQYTYDFFTTRSLHKIYRRDYDIIILDEIHDYSIGQLEMIKWMAAYQIVGLTGTLTKKSTTRINEYLGINVLHKYTITEGVKDGILSDYIIYHHEVPFESNRKTVPHKNGLITELEKYRKLVYVNSVSPSFYTESAIRSFLSNLDSKINYTRKLIEKNSDRRILVFNGSKESCNKLGIPVYYSGKKETSTFVGFTEGIIPHLAVVKMMSSGVTIRSISMGIMNAITGNPEDMTQIMCRFLGYEYDNPEKKAEIHIITSTAGFELERLETALMFMDKEKVKKHDEL